MLEDWFPADDVRVAETVKFVGQVKGKRVLEAGMKYGFALQRIDAGTKVGFDTEPKYVLASNVRLKFCGDVFALPFRDKSFDLVLFTEVIEHLQDPKKALAELSRVAEKIVVSTPNNSWARKIKHKLLGKGNIIAQNHIREYSLTELREMAHESGLEISRVRGLGFFATYRLQGLMNALGKMMPGLAANLLLELKHA